MPVCPKWRELFPILYRTPFPTELNVNITVAVTVCRFRIFTIEQIILNPVTVAKRLVVLTVLEDSCVVVFAKTTAHRNQILQRATMLVFQYSGPLRCQLTYYAKLRPLAVCIHIGGSNGCKV